MKKKNAEVQSRRDFFKKAAKTALPILGIAVFGPSLLTSCEPDDEDNSSGCEACTNQCLGCGFGCENDCSGSCEYGSH